VVGSVPDTDVHPAVPRDPIADKARHRKEAIMPQHPHLMLAIAKQHQAELIAAAERYRLARSASSTRSAAPAPLRRRSQHAARRLGRRLRLGRVTA
jgi:hypothetical protein